MDNVREEMFRKLTKSQVAALDFITAYAKGRKQQSEQVIEEILLMSNITKEDYDHALLNLKTHTRIALHFHPDRLDGNLNSVAAGLLEHGVYKSQFETLISNGSVSAYPGGHR